jgi:lipopolysaccharide biosynthesis glycosyltransferase
MPISPGEKLGVARLPDIIGLRREQRISVLMAVDERYAAPFLVTVASLLESLRPGVGLDLYVMGSGLRPGTRSRLEGGWDGRVRLHWAPLDNSKLESLRGYAYPSSPVANFRLVVGSSLPGDVSKVIYLDADLLIQRDIFELWEQDMQGKIVLAVQDSYIQKLPARYVPARAEADQPYFNSGVMVINLEAWRMAEIEQCCLEAARRLAHRTKWLDQHVLNACLAGRWGRLTPVWNKQFFLDVFPDWRCGPYAEKEFLEARSDLAIIHFSSRTKPWHTFCDHPRQDVLAYRAALRRSALGAGLEARPSLARRTGEFFAAPHRHLLDGIAAAVRAKRRKHALRMMLPGMLRLAILHPWTLATVPLSVAHERAARWLAGRLSRLSAVRRPRRC